MSQDLPTTPATAFGLETFADLLPGRAPIPGEEPGSFETFHAGMMASLAPATPYECIIAENLIAIEWQLVQHRRMRDANLREIIRNAICEAVVHQREAAYSAARDEAWDRHLEAGGDKDDWQFSRFDGDAAEEAGEHLAARAMSRDPEVQARACDEVSALGMELVDIMGEAYRSLDSSMFDHGSKIPSLERRRRAVKHDFDALQRARPVEATVIDS